MRSRVFRLLLENRDRHLSGEKISEMLGISRAAVWKHIAAIKEDGAIIESVSNKGYLLLSLPDKLKKEYVSPFVEETYQDKKIFWTETIDSTNKYAKQIAAEEPGEFVVFAEAQDNGRGRLGRVWESPKGNIYASFLLRKDMMPERAAGITLAAAMAVIDAVESTLCIRPSIKWPNDIILEGKKLCGILTEMSAEIDKIEYLVIGPGINVNARVGYSEDLEDKVISLRDVLGMKIDRLELAGALVNAMFKRCADYAEHGLKNMIEDYQKRSCILGKEVFIIKNGQQRAGIVTGFTENGELKFESEGETLYIATGEVSVRGLNGYI